MHSQVTQRMSIFLESKERGKESHEIREDGQGHLGMSLEITVRTWLLLMEWNGKDKFRIVTHQRSDMMWLISEGSSNYYVENRL